MIKPDTGGTPVPPAEGLAPLHSPPPMRLLAPAADQSSQLYALGPPFPNVILSGAKDLSNVILSGAKDLSHHSLTLHNRLRRRSAYVPLMGAGLCPA